MTDLEKLKKTFDEIGVPYIEKVDEDDPDYISIFTCTVEAQKSKILPYYCDVFFEFCNGKLASSP